MSNIGVDWSNTTDGNYVINMNTESMYSDWIYLEAKTDKYDKRVQRLKDYGKTH